ncbi:MAG: HU family DNA-binding protein [Paracoccus sp. (in: a-proteobacteria)]|nr:HU family DNA-binding protein [Paracoccus sp. (in: a-proteobacteria)]
MSDHNRAVAARSGQRRSLGSVGYAESRGEPVPARIVQKKEFLDRVVAASGAGRSTARPIIDAVLEQLGEAIAAGETLAIPPFGKARVSHQRDIRGSDVITMRLRRKSLEGATQDDS